MVASVVATGVGLSVPWGAIGPRQQPPASRSKPVTMPAPNPRYDFDGPDRGKGSTPLATNTTQKSQKRLSDERQASGPAVARLLAAARGEVAKPGFALDPGKSQQDVVVVDRRPITPSAAMAKAVADVALPDVPAVSQSEAVPTSPPVRVTQAAPASPLERFPSSSEEGASIQNFSDRLASEMTAQGYSASGAKSLAFSGATPGFAEVGDGVLENLADVPRFRTEPLPAMALAADPVAPTVDNAGAAKLASAELAYQGGTPSVTEITAPVHANFASAGAQELDLGGFEHPAESSTDQPYETEEVPQLAVIDLTQEADYRVSVAYSPDMAVSDQALPEGNEDRRPLQLSDALTDEEAAIAFSRPSDVPVEPLQRAALIENAAGGGLSDLQQQPAVASTVSMPSSPASFRQAATQTAYSIPVTVHGIALGSVPIRVGGAEGLSVSLAGLLSLVRPQMDAARYLRFSRATSAADYVDLEQLRAAGFSVAFDNSTDSLVLAAR